MAKEIPDLEATVRAGTGKGAARQARRDGLVPGIVFGGDAEPLSLNIPFNKLLKMLKAGRFKSTLFNLKVEGHDDVRVICRDVQRDKVKDLPTHFDLMRLRRTSKIALFLPVEFINEEECKGLKKGGTLNVVRNEVEVIVTAADIPEKIVIDLAGLDFGDNMTSSTVTFPAGSKPSIDRDFVIATIAQPSGLSAADEDEDDVDADDVPATEVAEG